MSSSVVTLLVALGGVFGTLASAILTQRGADRAKRLELAHLDKQRQEDREYSQKERRHQQRREAYAHFIELIGSLHSQLYELRSPSHDTDSYRQAYEQARLSRAALLKQTHVVLLEGPKEVSDKSRNLYNVMNSWLAATHAMHNPTDGESSVRGQSGPARFNQLRGEYKVARENFVDEAQKALRME